MEPARAPATDGGPAERERMGGTGRGMAAAGVLAMLAGARPAVAQSPPCPAPGDSAAASADTARGPLVRIVARVTAAELRLRTRPRAEVRFAGCAPPDTLIVTERVNLPDPVEPGVTYRDVRVGVDIRTHLNVFCPRSDAGADAALERLCDEIRTALAALPEPPEDDG